jgi:hypothetical protein
MGKKYDGIRFFAASETMSTGIILLLPTSVAHTLDFTMTISR